MKALGQKTIKASIGSGLLDRIFGGRSFIHCVRELIKNCRDWGATQITIVSSDRTQFVIADNGDGMDADNRNAFCSINTTTAKGRTQAGKFGTGTKMMLFSQAASVRVITAPKDEPGLVYTFTITREEYERLVLSGGTIEPEWVEKTPISWPYESRFGTVLTYTLHTPSRTTIHRGERLRKELASVLPMHYGDIVIVDGQPLPPKEIIGDAFSEVRSSVQLGEVALELYRPKRRSAEEGVLFTAVEIGEVPIDAIARVLPSELRAQIPAVMMHPDVCGTIRAEFFNDHVNEDRMTVATSMADDPRVRHLLRLFAELAPRIEQRLKLILSTSEPGTASAQRSFEEVVATLNTIYGNDGAPSVDGEAVEGTVDDDLPPSGDPSEQPPIAVRINRREYSLGEAVEVTAAIRRDLADKHDVDHLRWYTDRARSRRGKVSKGGITLTTTDLGHAVVTVDIPGTALSGSTHFDVVAQRVFAISNPHASVSSGGSLVIMTRNHDLLSGNPVWELDGTGTLTAQGKRAIYHAAGIGRVVVRARDPEDPQRFATCDIAVTGQPRKLLHLRKRWYEYSCVMVQQARPVIIVRGDKVHRLNANMQSPGFARAMRNGRERDYWFHAIASELARFELFEFGDSDPAELDPRDFDRLVGGILMTADEIYSEFSAE